MKKVLVLLYVFLNFSFAIACINKPSPWDPYINILKYVFLLLAFGYFLFFLKNLINYFSIKNTLNDDNLKLFKKRLHKKFSLIIIFALISFGLISFDATFCTVASNTSTNIIETRC